MPCSARQMTAVEAAWLAGFVDGEGSIAEGDCKSGAYKGWFISVPNTCRASLVRCRSYAGTGSIRNKGKPKKKSHKPQWVWRLSAQRDVADICRQLLPYLIIKRKAAERFLREWRDI